MFQYLMISALKFMALPVVFGDALITDLRLEWLKFDRLLAGGQRPPLQQLLPFFKWVLILLVVVCAVFFLVLVTVRSIIFDDLDRKTFGAVIGDFLILAMVLFFYYFLFASVVYFFFYIVLPMH